jgi:multiple antibiotic resistance protein
MTFLSFFALSFSSLFTVIDPFATAPVFTSLTQHRDRATSMRIAIRACAVALGVLLLFAAGGTFLFRVFGITIDAFRIGGGLVFLGIGLPMLGGSAHGSTTAVDKDSDPSVVPLGVPLIGGPGAITTIMVLMGQTTSAFHVVAVIVALLFALAATAVLLIVSPRILKRLGSGGLELITKVMGLIIVVIGVQFIVDGARPILVDILKSAHT